MDVLAAVIPAVGHEARGEDSQAHPPHDRRHPILAPRDQFAPWTRDTACVRRGRVSARVPLLEEGCLADGEMSSSS